MALVENNSVTSAGEEQIKATVDKAHKRPEVVVNVGQLRDNVNLALKALQGANDPPALFSRGGILARLRDDGNSVELEALGDAGLLSELAEAADWKKITKSDVIDAEPPSSIIRAIRGRRQLPFPPIESIASAPFFTRQGELVLKQGYHRGAGVYLSLDSQLATQLSNIVLPEQPTREDVEWAKSHLFDELLCDFPFADEASKAHAVALGLLPFVRNMIDGPSPNHAVVAPPRCEGTGKGKLVESVLAAGLGEIAAAPETKNREEMRKVLSAVVIENSPVFWIDNAQNEINAGPYAAALTARNLGDRILGKTKRFRGRVLTVWIITGNGLRVSREIWRRTIFVRLDAKMPEPWHRIDFRHPLPTWAYAHRAELILAFVILVRNWLALGEPVGKRSLGSFEAWAQVIGGILEAAGIPHFLETPAEVSAEADQETQRWQDFIEAWWGAHGATPVTAQTLLEIASELVPEEDDKSERSRASRLGRLLNARVGAMFAVSAGWVKTSRAPVERRVGGAHKGFALVESKPGVDVGDVGGKPQDAENCPKTKKNSSANGEPERPAPKNDVGERKTRDFIEKSVNPPTSPTSTGDFRPGDQSAADDGDRF